MGIELPAELAPLAQATGVRWPQADEDQMRAAATAWREAATRMTTLTGDADTTASSAFGTFSGEAADAARATWSAYVGPDTGHLTVTARGCLAAADRLDHAADQVGAAKVEIVRQLVDLSKNTGVAEATGTAQALLGVDTAVTATAANLAAVTDGLVDAVAPGGPDVTSVRQVAQADPGVRPSDAAPPPRGGLLGGGLLTGVVRTVAPVADVVPAVTSAVAPAPGSPLPVATVVGAVTGGPSGVDGTVDSDVAAAVRPANQGLLGGVGNLVEGVTGKQGLVGGITDAVSGQHGLVGGITNAVAGQQGLVSGITNAVAGDQGLVSGITNAVAGEQGLVSGITNAVAGDQGLVSGITSAVAGDQGLVSGITNAVAGDQGLVRGVTEAVQGTVGGVTDAVQGVVRETGQAVGGVAETVERVVDTTGRETSQAVGGIGGAVDQVPERAHHVAESAPSTVDQRTVDSVLRPGPADEWAMDLPTPPAGMPVVDTVQAASAAVLDAPAPAAQNPAAPAPGAVGGGAAPGGLGGGGLGGGGLAGGGAIGGVAGGGALPGPRAQGMAAPLSGGPTGGGGGGTGTGAGSGVGRTTAGPASSGPGAGLPGAQAGAPGSASPGGPAHHDPAAVEPELSEEDEQEPTPATGFGIVPVLGGVAGGFLAANPGLGGPQAPAPAAGTPGARPAAGGGPLFGLPVTPTPAERTGLARLPGVFAGVSIADPHRDQLSLFLLHLFPIGHLPQVLDEPHRQLPAPHSEVDYAAGLRFPPDDHPDAHLVDATTPTRYQRTEGASPAPLAEGHDPLGGMHERDWERRYLVRPADARGRAEHNWPPGESYPEGGTAYGDPEVLAPGTVVDRIGTPEGRVFAEDATPFTARSLPPDHLGERLRRYTVARPLPVWRAASAPWFGQRGGGIRLRTTRSAAELVALGYLVEITEDQR